jgi:hypothetical protein
MLRDAATYITKLPKAEHITPEWQAAMEALILVAENFGPTMLPCLVALKALNRHRLECSIGDCCPWVVARVDRSLHVLLNFFADTARDRQLADEVEQAMKAGNAETGPARE